MMMMIIIHPSIHPSINQSINQSICLANLPLCDHPPFRRRSSSSSGSERFTGAENRRPAPRTDADGGGVAVEWRCFFLPREVRHWWDNMGFVLIFGMFLDDHAL